MISTARPNWWPKACRALSLTDPVMARLVLRHSKPGMTLRGDPFFTLARAIVGQQISVKAAATVWGRLTAVVGCLTPRCILENAGDLGQVGLSARKIEYLLDLSKQFDREPDLAERLHALDDESVVARLTEIRGIGRWTAEMALIFSLARPNVLPVADLGLLKAISLHYRNGATVDSKAAREIAQPWQPWQSAATWLLWRSLDPEPVEY
jgi:DNA-3-methyladenine glycosylase II